MVFSTLSNITSWQQPTAHPLSSQAHLSTTWHVQCIMYFFCSHTFVPNPRLVFVYQTELLHTAIRSTRWSSPCKSRQFYLDYLPFSVDLPNQVRWAWTQSPSLPVVLAPELPENWTPKMLKPFLHPPNERDTFNNHVHDSWEWRWQQLTTSKKVMIVNHGCDHSHC